jgi:Protein of unknown function (DUF3106)
LAVKIHPQFGSLVLSAVLLVPSALLAQKRDHSDHQHHGEGRREAPAFNPRPSAGNVFHAIQQQQQPGGGGRQGNRGRGKWLQEHGNLPPQEQEKALEKDPEFQRLPPQRQEQLKQNLRRFNTLPPDQRQRTLNRMAGIEQLPPDKRQQLQSYMSQFRDLPLDRRQMIRKAYRNLHEMPPEEQQRVMNSDRFRGAFNDNERSILNGMLGSGVDLEGDQGPFNPNAPRR